MLYRSLLCLHCLLVELAPEHVESLALSRVDIEKIRGRTWPLLDRPSLAELVVSAEEDFDTQARRVVNDVAEVLADVSRAQIVLHAEFYRRRPCRARWC